MTRSSTFRIGDSVQPMDWGFQPEACPTIRSAKWFDADGCWRYQLDFPEFAAIPPGVDISELGPGTPADFWFHEDEIELM